MQGVVANHTGRQNEGVARSSQIPSERRNILRRQFQAEAASAELQADRALEEQLCNPGWPARSPPRRERRRRFTTWGNTSNG
jgi:hypothetical protein